MAYFWILTRDTELFFPGKMSVMQKIFNPIKPTLLRIYLIKQLIQRTLTLRGYPTSQSKTLPALLRKKKGISLHSVGVVNTGRFPRNYLASPKMVEQGHRINPWRAFSSANHQNIQAPPRTTYTLGSLLKVDGRVHSSLTGMTRSRGMFTVNRTTNEV